MSRVSKYQQWHYLLFIFAQISIFGNYSLYCTAARVIVHNSLDFTAYCAARRAACSSASSPTTIMPMGMASSGLIATGILPNMGHGSGSALPLPILLVAGVCTAVATIVSAVSITMHLKNYRKPHLQRYVLLKIS